MDGTDPYDVLGVERNASEEEIREAYREMVKKHHPDVSEAEGAERKFRRIKEAYNSIRAESGGADERQKKDAAKTEQRRTSDAGKAREGGKRKARSGGTGWARDGFEVRANYDDGWKVAVCREGAHVGEWVVYKPFRSAGHGGTTARYLDKQGGLSNDPVYFGTRKQAETGYDRYLEAYSNRRGETGGEGRRRGTTKSHRKQKRKPRSRPDSGGEDETEDAERMKGLDSLWFLYRREIAGGVERWAVATDTGSKYYLNDSGEQQRDGFWFSDREDAEAAYNAYMEGAADVGGPSRNLTGGRRRDDITDDSPDIGTGEDKRPPVSPLGRVLDAFEEYVEKIRGYVGAFVFPWAVVSSVLKPIVLSESPSVPWRRMFASAAAGYAVALTAVWVLMSAGYTFTFTDTFVGDFLIVGGIFSVLSYAVVRFVATNS